MTWQELEKQNALYWIFFIGLVPFGIFLSVLRALFSIPDVYLIPFAVIWFLTAGWFALKRGTIECPRCHEIFFQSHHFETKCDHCGAKPPGKAAKI